MHRPLRLYPNINIRIIAPFLLIVAMVAALGAFITTRLVVGSIQERFTNQLADSASAATNGLADTEKQMMTTLRLMAFTQGVPKALRETDATTLQALIGPVAGNSTFERIIVFGQTGRIVLDMDRAPEGYSLSDAELRTWRIVDDVLSRRSDRQGDKFAAIIETRSEPMLFMSVPITDPEGMLVGGIIAGLTTRTFLSRLSQQSLSGIILYSPTGKAWGSTYGTRSALPPLAGETFNRIARAVQNSSPLEEVQIDGRSYEALYAPLILRQEQAGIMAVTLSSNFIVERSAATRNIFLALFAGLFIGVILIGLRVSRTITRPVARLVATTRAIRAGDLSRRVNLKTPDELGELGSSFNLMTEQLVRRNIQVNQLYKNQVRETARRGAIIASISDALFVLNPHSRPVVLTPAARELLQSLSGQQAMRAKLRGLLNQVENFDETHTVELGPRTFRTKTARIRTSDGEMLGSVLALQDITALVETERTKDDLIKQISHEFRTPLTAIRGYIELVKILEASRLSEQGVAFITNALEGVSTMERMANQVIEVSTIISNHFELEKTTFDLAELLDRLHAEWLPLCTKRDLSIEVTAPHPMPLYADEVRLEQVMNHLMRNAYSYTLPGGHIVISANKATQAVSITICDTGVGIAADEIDRVFDRLYRGRSADAGPTDARGLGLGLYLSKTLVEAHQGTIVLESQVDHGTTVTIRLPNGDGADG